MGLEISGTVEGSSVIVAGETVTVAVTLSASHRENNTYQDSSGEQISWCSAQIHCLSATNESYVIPPTPVKPVSSETEAGTSFAPWKGESGNLILLTKPTILSCDLLLQPGQSRTFRYKETIPRTGPPSYRGHRVKYSWKVTVGVQRLGAKIALIRLPLRVILLPTPSAEALEAAYSSSEEELSPSNPFLHISHSSPNKEAPVSSPAALLQAWPTRSVRAYNIVHSKGHVVKFSIFRSSYKLGDDILATLDFTNGSIPCVQYSVCLQSVEEIKEEHRRRSKQTPSILSYSKTHELCLSLSHTSMLLPVPLHVTPAFQTDIVDLQYRLHFEFVLSLNKKSKQSSATASTSKKLSRSSSTGSTGAESTNSAEDSTFSDDLRGPYESGTFETLDDGTEIWRAPQELNIETLVWDLPIHICPTAPQQLAAGLNLPQSCATVAV